MDYPIIKIDNVNNKLAADRWLHVAKPTHKIFQDLVNEKFYVDGGSGEKIKAEIEDYSVGRVFEYSETTLLLATGKGWDELKNIYGKDAMIAVYLMRKVKEDGTE